MSRRDVLVLLAIALACGGLAFGLSVLGGRARPGDALAAAPEGSSIAVQIDAPALRASPIWQAMVDDDEGMERVRSACGFDPLERLRTVSIFVIGTEARPFERVGFLARGQLPHEELVRCVERVVGDEGVGLERVEIEGVPALASGSSRAAFVGDDGVVGGDELVVREVIRPDHGDAPGADRDPTLRALWRRVQGRREIVAVARVPDNWREWLGRLGGEVDLDALDRVRALGIGARVQRGLGLTVALETGTERGAEGIVESVRDQLRAVLDDPLLRMSAAGAALRRVELEASGSVVIATLDLDEERLGELVQLARDLVARRRAAAERRRERELAPPAPDETLQPEDHPLGE